jgi:hypothetical protein
MTSKNVPDAFNLASVKCVGLTPMFHVLRVSIRPNSLTVLVTKFRHWDSWVTSVGTVSTLPPC